MEKYRKKELEKLLLSWLKKKKALKSKTKSKKKLETKAVVELADDTENDSEVIPHITAISVSEDAMKGAYSVEFSGELIDELVDFLKEKENSDDYLLIKKVLLALKNAKQTGE